MSALTPSKPLYLGSLFEGLHVHLMEVLDGLKTDDWSSPTGAGHWSVREIAAHLLDGDLRQISFRLHGHPPAEPPFPIRDYADLVRFIDLLNRQWVDATARLSPRILVELLRWSGPQVAALFRTLEPSAPALFGVAWAGESASLNWFDTAREYTERWHHQQQIRDAVNAPPLTQRHWLHPVLDTFLRALPHAYRTTRPGETGAIAFRITGEAGDDWSLLWSGDMWVLHEGLSEVHDALFSTDQDAAWRLLTKGLPVGEANERVEVSGDRRLATPFLEMRSIMG